jgi:hypothetical protein
MFMAQEPQIPSRQDRLMIPTEAGHGFRFEAGHCSGMKAASIPR